MLQPCLHHADVWERKTHTRPGNLSAGSANEADIWLAGGVFGVRQRRESARSPALKPHQLTFGRDCSQFKGPKGVVEVVVVGRTCV